METVFQFRDDASAGDAKRRILSEWMWTFRPIGAKTVLFTAADPRRALRELRKADPVGYALLTEHLDVSADGWLS